MLTLVFLSGASALAYQLVWGRMLSVLFGDSTQAVAVVVAVFMGGLALGSFVFGNVADRVRRPLLFYAGVEAAIGVSAFFVPFLLNVFEPWIASLYASGDPTSLRLLLTRFTISGFAILIPTFLMGATFPVVVRAMVRRPEETDRTLGLIYGINTLGGMGGTILTGFLLLRYLGVRYTLHLACATNLVIAGIALLLHQMRSKESVEPAVRTDEPRPPASALLLSVIFISGFTALSYELIWTRVLAFIFPSGMDMKSFTIVLAVFLGGIAGGGFLHAKTERRLSNKTAALGILQIVVAASVYCLFWLLAWNRLFAQLWIPWNFLLNEAAKAAFLVGIPALVFGYSFPLSCSLVTSTWKAVGGSVGRAYAINTIGGVLGPLVCGFLLIPSIGSERTIKGMVVLGISLGLALLVSEWRQKRLPRSPVVAGAVLLGLFGILFVSPGKILVKLMNLDNRPVLYYGEDRSGIYLAFQIEDGIRIRMGGIWSGGAAPKQAANGEMSAYLPLLLHPAPERVAVIGFGAGATASHFARNPAVRNVDIIEIMEEAVVAGRTLFASYNDHVLDSPKVRVVVDDGFNYLKYTSQTYDVVAVTAFTPKLPSAARLYTREFVEIVRKKLRPGGMIIFWAFPAHINAAAFFSALSSLQSVYPHLSVWTTPEAPYFFFFGSDRDPPLDRKKIEKRMRQRPSPVTTPYRIQTVDQFLSHRLLDERAVAEALNFRKPPINTLDRPVLEYLIRKGRAPNLIEELSLLQKR
ncbi:MAG: fused MFS/spermidine synthase [Pseudomonadota bacterium]